MSDALITQWRRLFLRENQLYATQNEKGDYPAAAGILIPADLKEHLAGLKTIAVRMIDSDDNVRYAGTDFDDNSPETWEAVLYARKLMMDVGLPAPVITASGNKGWHVLSTFSEPVPASEARRFAHLIKNGVLRKRAADRAKTPGASADSDPLETLIDPRPDAVVDNKAAQGNLKLCPCLHRKVGRWGQFVPVTDEGTFQPASYATAPDFDEQAELLADVVQATPAQLDGAIAQLEARGCTANIRDDDPPPQPNLTQLKPGQHPPCVEALLKDGVPDDVHVSIGNLNGASYCRGRNFTEGEAREFATEMALATSPDHSSSKRTVRDRVENFMSNRRPGPFACWARRTKGWREALKEHGGCDACPINPDGYSSFAGPRKAAGASGDGPGSGAGPGGKKGAEGLLERLLSDVSLPAPVALDIIAFCWDRNIGLPHLKRVWPDPFYGAAAEVCGASATPAALYGALQKFEAALGAKEKAEFRERLLVFLTALKSRIVEFRAHGGFAEKAFGDALQLAEDRERRARLGSELAKLGDLGPTASANVIAGQLVKAASGALSESTKGGVIANQREDLLAFFRAEEQPHVPLPYQTLTRELRGGFIGGCLYGIVAGPKSGKTTFVSGLMDHAARLGIPTVYLGYEMSIRQMMTIAAARKARIDSATIHERKMTPYQQHQLAKALNDYFDHEGQMIEYWEASLDTTLADAHAWVTRQKQKYPNMTPFVVVDYMQIGLTGDDAVDLNPEETVRVSRMAVALKDLARSTGAVVLALSSITKAAEVEYAQTGKMTSLSVRGSHTAVHAFDALLSLNVGDITIAKKPASKDDDVEKQIITPWELTAEDKRKNGYRGAEHYARAYNDAAEKYPPHQYGNTVAHARVDIVEARNGGKGGSVYFLYRKHLGEFIEVDVYGHLEGQNTRPPPEFDEPEFFEPEDEIVVETPEPGAADAYDALADLDLEIPEPVTEPTGPDIDYRLIASDEEVALIDWLLVTTDRVGIDFETTGLDPKSSYPRLLSIAHAEHGVFLVDLTKITGGVKTLVPHLIAGAQLVAHNAVFDLKFIAEHAGLHDLIIDCSMIAARVAGADAELNLRAVVKRFLGVDLAKELQRSDWSGDLTQEQLRYAALDSKILLQLWERIWAEIEDRQSERAYRLVRDAQPAIVQMELAGMPFDVVRQKALQQGLETQRDALLAELCAAMGVRKPTGNELLAWFTTQLGGEGSKNYEKWPKTSSGKLSTREDDIKADVGLLLPAAQEVMLKKLLPYKTVEKRLTAFGTNLAGYVNPVTGRIHASFKLTGAVTGRLACASPNLQQIPKDEGYRDLFRSTEIGRVLAIADYNAAELRVAAELAGETRLLDALREGRDTHKLTASLILGKSVDVISDGERQLAKAVNFGLL